MFSGALNRADKRQAAMKDEVFLFSNPLVAGHRGFSAKYPENTMVSFEAAALAGVGMIELDITLTRDSKIVVIHDDTLDRTTNGSGLVGSYTLAELRRLDAGSWFHQRFAGEKVPMLDEVLNAFVGRVMINIEIKPNITNEFYIERIVDQTLEAVDARKAIGEVLISSFDPEILQRVAMSRHHPAIALLLEEAIEENALALAEKLGAVSIHPNMDTLDTEAVNRVHSRRFFVFPYNVDSEKKMRRAFKMGIDGLFADDPAMAIKCYQDIPKRRLRREDRSKR
jgi:glycerophosphoryl diester phosphodiesterase